MSVRFLHKHRATTYHAVDGSLPRVTFSPRPHANGIPGGDKTKQENNMRDIVQRRKGGGKRLMQRIEIVVMLMEDTFHHMVFNFALNIGRVAQLS